MTTSRDEIVRLVSLYGATCMGYMGGDRTPLNDSNATLMSAIDRVLDRQAELEKALKASPCTIDGFDRLVWDCKERNCLRCAALATEQPHE